jgi:hypothetical protein
MRFAAVLCAILVACGHLQAQEQAPTIRVPDATRDERGLTLLQQCVSVLLPAGSKSLGSSKVVGSVVPKDDVLASGDFVWESKNRELRFDNPTKSGRSILATGHGRPAFKHGDSIVPLGKHLAKSFLAPHLIGAYLDEYLKDQKATVGFLGPDTLNKKPVLRVWLSFASDPSRLGVPPIGIWIDAQTNLPLRVEYEVPDNLHPGRSLHHAFELADYRLVSDVLVPHEISFYFEKSLQAIYEIKSVDLTTQPADSNFDLDAKESE